LGVSFLLLLLLLLLLIIIIIIIIILLHQEISRALIEADVNIRLVSQLRKNIKEAANLEEAPAGNKGIVVVVVVVVGGGGGELRVVLIMNSACSDGDGVAG